MKNILKYLRVDHSSGIPVSIQLSQQLSWLIAGGEIKKGEKLPSALAMAEHLGIHLHTARSAYQRLKDIGIVEIQRGRGTTVLEFTKVQLAQQGPDISSFVVGVLIADYHPFYIPLLKGIEDGMADTPTQIIVCSTRDQLGDRSVDRLLVRGVDGFILASTEMSSDFKPESEGRPGRASPLPPVVYVDNPKAKGYSILLDLEGAGFQATHHLIEHGHTRIGLITCPPEWPNVSQTFLGHCKALNQAKLAVDQALISIAPKFELEAGHQAMLRLLESGNPPSAIFAIDDILAAGAMKALKESGLRIPRDIALASCINLEFSSIVDPPLTTVQAPAYEMGLTAAEMVLSLILGKEVRPKKRIFETQLIVRESCGCKALGSSGHNPISPD